MSFEILNSFLVFFSGGFGFERAKVPAFPGLRILLARIQTVSAFNFSAHRANSKNAFSSRISIRNVFKSTFAGPWVTLPVRTSKRDLCHGHSTSKPSKQPSDKGPKRCVQNS